MYGVLGGGVFGFRRGEVLGFGSGVQGFRVFGWIG